MAAWSAMARGLGPGGGRARAPRLRDAVRKRSEEMDAPFYFPGHKRGGDAAARRDLPELEEVDNLFAPTAAIKDAQDAAAGLFGAATTLFSVNGSTAGVVAAILATCDEQHALVLPRDAHQSATHGLVLSGARPVYLQARHAHGGDVSLGTSAEDVAAALEANPAQVGAVLIVSPSYHGMCADVAAVAAVCALHRVPLLVDEAHGAHLGLSADLPRSALQQGACVAVQSTHKSLGALSQAGMVHVAHGARVDAGAVRRALHTLTSSSPSYLLLASLDAARAQVDGKAGAAALAAVSKRARDTRERIEGIGWACLDSDDPWKITVLLDEDDTWSGDDLDDFTCDECGVVCELPRPRSVLYACGIGTTQDHADRLVESLARARDAMDRHTDRRVDMPPPPLPALPLPSARLTPRAAFLLARRAQRCVPAADAVGSTSAEVLAPYPPGVPLIVPGETFTQVVLDALQSFARAGGAVAGASDPTLCTVAVLDDM